MSNLFNLNWKDFVHGLFIAILSAVFTFILKILPQKGFNLSTEDLQMMGTVAVIAAVSYLSKQFCSDNSGKLGGKL